MTAFSCEALKASAGTEEEDGGTEKSPSSFHSLQRRKKRKPACLLSITAMWLLKRSRKNKQERPPPSSPSHLKRRPNIACCSVRPFSPLFNPIHTFPLFFPSLSLLLLHPTPTHSLTRPPFYFWLARLSLSLRPGDIRKVKGSFLSLFSSAPARLFRLLPGKSPFSLISFFLLLFLLDPWKSNTHQIGHTFFHSSLSPSLHHSIKLFAQQERGGGV